MRSLVIFAVLFALAGCGSIMHGTTQSVGISSTPTGANVSVDNKPLGDTPLVADLKRKDHHYVKIEMEGYQPFEMTVTRSVSGWVWGNLLFGGIIGLIVDASDGALYKLTPEQVAGSLSRTGAQIQKLDGMIYVGVTLTPDPSWKQVSTLKPTSVSE